MGRSAAAFDELDGTLLRDLPYTYDGIVVLKGLNKSACPQGAEQRRTRCGDAVGESAARATVLKATPGVQMILQRGVRLNKSMILRLKVAQRDRPVATFSQ